MTIKPDEDFVGFNKTSIIKVNGKLDTSFRSIFDAELDNVESINVKADLGELSISEVDSQSLMDALHGRFVKTPNIILCARVNSSSTMCCIIVCSRVLCYIQFCDINAWCFNQCL